MIDVKNLVKRYGDHVAVDNLTFHVEKGQIYGFLGANGAGKSTTMNMMTGYLSPTGGQIVINGHDITEEPEEAKKSIGYLPEIPPLYMDMTVLEYLDFCSELKKLPKASREDEVDRVIAMVHIEDVANRLIKNLSKGYRQRVGLAQAILGMPPVIILDEPSVGLDPRQIIEIREIIRSLGQEHTVILSSHIMQEVSAVCDHVLIIAKGKLVATGSPAELAKMLAGDNTYRMTIKGAQDTIEAALNKIPEVKSVSFSSSEEEGCLSVLVKAEDTKDIREDMFMELAAVRCPVMQMSHESASLEDIFLELTEGKTASDMGSAAEASEEETSDASEETSEEESEEASEKEEE
ncbi:MAG: ABC transporter ATP-binding protein [Lachnospiraceae bacterium]|nr:ABC transporter ATP-binding protein [Lachnospiraceae bacterium]